MNTTPSLLITVCLLAIWIHSSVISAQTTWMAESDTAAMRLGSHVIGCDVNADGFTDIVSTGLISAFVFLGAPNGTFSNTPSFVLPVLNAATITTDGLGLECADLNRDGFADVVVGNWTGSSYQTILIYYGTSTGVQTQPFSWTFTSGSWYYGCDIAAADYNRDGKMDLAIGSYGYGQVYIHYGNDNGISPTWTAPSAMFVHQLTFSQNIAPCDLSNDNFPDMLVGWRNSNSSQGSLWIYSNVGGSWQSPPAKVYWGNATAGAFGVDAKCGDFNADGKKDFSVSWLESLLA